METTWKPASKKETVLSAICLVAIVVLLLVVVPLDLESMNDVTFYIDCPCCGGALTVVADLDNELYHAKRRHPFFGRFISPLIP